MSSSPEQIGWSEIWNVVKGTDKVARRRAFRETGTVLAVALIPLLLGAFFSYVEATRISTAHAGYIEFAVRATFGGQLFLLFLSLAGLVLARLWDPDGPRYTFSGLLNVVCLIGAAMSAGLLAIDVDMKSFAFWPVGLLSVVFFVVGLLYYLILAIPSYITQPDIPATLSAESKVLGANLAKRMKSHGA
jgi:hypothetical protein